MVEPLEQSITSQLRATLHITTLQQCLEQLVYNALDAQASLVDITFDANKYYVCVEDNGTGICSDALPRLAQQHVTSKCHTMDDLYQVSTFGFRGEALANLAELGILQIVSRYGDNQTAMAIWKDGKLIETSTTIQRRNPGTTVSIRDLFYKFPARRHTLTLTDRAVKRFVITTALAFPHVGFTIVDRDTKIFSTKKCSSDMSLFRQVFGQPFAEHIRSYEYHYGAIKLQGFFGIVPYPSKAHQYIFVNRIFIPQNDVYKKVSDAFNESSIMNQDRFQLKQTRKTKGRNAVEKYPVFVIHVDHPSLSTYDITIYRDALPEHKQIHSQLETSVSILTANFLRSHGFITGASYQGLLGKKATTPTVDTCKSVSQMAAVSWRDSTARKLYQLQHGNPRSANVGRSHIQKKAAAIPSEGPSSLSTPQRLRKDDLKHAEVLGQVDSKFIAIKVNRTLLLVDQHAADERVQLERMLWSLKDNVQVIQVEPPIPIDLTDKEQQQAIKCTNHMQRWGIHVSLQQQQNRRSSVETVLFASPHFATPDISPHFRQNQGALVTRLPRVIAERCLANHRLLRDMIREYIHWVEMTDEDRQHCDDQESQSFAFLRTCPPGMMQLLRSIACRGAIMFNDVLTPNQCCALMDALFQCRFPFQCVHGRPSMVPLTTLSGDSRPRRHRSITWRRFCT